MKTLVVTSDKHLINALQDISLENRVIIAENFEEMRNKVESDISKVVCFTDALSDIQPWSWLEFLKNAFSTSVDITVVLDIIDSSPYLEIISRVSSDFNFSVMPLGMTIEEKIEILKGEDKSKRENRAGRIVSFLSAKPGDGSTTIAINTARLLSSIKDAKICFVDLNIKSPDATLCVDLDRSKGISDLIPSIKSGRVTKQRLEKSSTKVWGTEVRFYPAPITRDTYEDLNITDISVLLDSLADNYDLVICDVGSYPDNAVTVSAVTKSDLVILSVSQLITSYSRSWNDWFDTYWRYSQLNKGRVKFVINKFTDSVGLGDSFIKKTIGLEHIVNVPVLPLETVVNLTNSCIPLVDELDKSNPYTEAISKICEKVLDETEFSGAVIGNVKTSKFKRFVGSLFGRW